MSEPFEIIGDSDERDEWLKLRRTGIGGSDAPAILGLSPWASPMSVQADKWGLLDEPEEAEHLRWGRRLESAILEGLADEFGEEIIPHGYLLRSTRHPFMLCTPDGRSAAGTWVQAKNTVLASEWDEGPPERVWVQCQHEMAVTGAQEMVAVALLMGRRLAWQTVKRDPAFIDERLIPAEQAFWAATQAHEPVASDGSQATRAALKALYPKDSGEIVALDGHFIDLDNERTDLLLQKKGAEARIDEIDNEIRAAMGTATYAVLPNGVRLSLKTQHRKGYEVKPTSFRVLHRKEERKK